MGEKKGYSRRDAVVVGAVGVAVPAAALIAWSMPIVATAVEAPRRAASMPNPPAPSTPGDLSVTLADRTYEVPTVWNKYVYTVDAMLPRVCIVENEGDEDIPLNQLSWLRTTWSTRNAANDGYYPNGTLSVRIDTANVTMNGVLAPNLLKLAFPDANMYFYYNWKEIVPGHARIVVPLIYKFDPNFNIDYYTQNGTPYGDFYIGLLSFSKDSNAENNADYADVNVMWVSGPNYPF